MATARPTWDEVLDAVAEDVRRAAELLFAPPAEPVPAATIAPVTLPDLMDMPPVPEALRARILELRAQIAQLQDELGQALREWQPPQQRVLLAAGAPERPLYVDRFV